MAEMRMYRTYNYIDKDPIIDKVRTLVQDEGLIKKLQVVHEISGVATATLDNWFNGTTRKPQHVTIAAVITSLGYQEEFVKKKDIDVETERKLGADWLAKREKQMKAATKPKPAKKRNGGRK
jgi:hypothetical protein